MPPTFIRRPVANTGVQDAYNLGWKHRSHSRRGRWCDMAVCGNRMKNRGVRSRQRRARP
jgi:predicted RNA-binding Zn ribbon-like protein